MNTDWVEVSRDLFYRIIGQQEVRPHVQPGKWPYTTIFRTPDNQDRGMTVDRDMGGQTVSTYWLPRPTSIDVYAERNTRAALEETK